jgi:hypothetical protein
MDRFVRSTRTTAPRAGHSAVAIPSVALLSCASQTASSRRRSMAICVPWPSTMGRCAGKYSCPMRCRTQTRWRGCAWRPTATRWWCSTASSALASSPWMGISPGGVAGPAGPSHRAGGGCWQSGRRTPMCWNKWLARRPLPLRTHGSADPPSFSRRRSPPGMARRSGGRAISPPSSRGGTVPHRWWRQTGGL